MYMCTCYMYVQVNAKVRNKTGLIMATAEGWLNVVQTLLEFNASVNESVCSTCSYRYNVMCKLSLIYRMKMEKLLYIIVPICEFDTYKSCDIY